jgi:hypothetical protein
MSTLQKLTEILSEAEITARNDFIAITLMEQLAQRPELSLSPSLIHLIEDFAQRAKLPTAADAKKIWAAVDRYLEQHPLDPTLLAKVQAALSS